MIPTVTGAKPAIYTVRVAAALLGVTPQSVYRWMDEGVLKEVPIEGRARVVDGPSLRALIRRRGGNSE